MEDAFFSQLDGNAVRELLLRTELRHAALFAVSDTLRIERCSDAAQQLSGLHPMEELDPFLSGSTRNILLRCINTQSACTAEEDIDGTVYTVEMIPHRGGALLAYLRRDRAAYDGSLRVIQDKSSRYLGALMAEAEQVEDPALADGLRRQCMRLYRLLTHSDLLHDPLCGAATCQRFAAMLCSRRRRMRLRAVQNSSYRCRSIQTRSLTRDWCVPQSITC